MKCLVLLKNQTHHLSSLQRVSQNWYYTLSSIAAAILSVKLFRKKEEKAQARRR